MLGSSKHSIPPHASRTSLAHHYSNTCQILSECVGAGRVKVGEAVLVGADPRQVDTLLLAPISPP